MEVANDHTQAKEGRAQYVGPGYRGGHLYRVWYKLGCGHISSTVVKEENIPAVLDNPLPYCMDCLVREFPPR